MMMKVDVHSAFAAKFEINQRLFAIWHIYYLAGYDEIIVSIKIRIFAL